MGKTFSQNCYWNYIIIKGKLKINDTIFSSGDIFVIEPNEIADPKFLEDSEVIIVKLPSNTSDKHNIERWSKFLLTEQFMKIKTIH